MKKCDPVASAIVRVIQGREKAYSGVADLRIQLTKLIQYAIDNRDEREIHSEEMEASKLVSETLNEFGYATDVYIGRDLWELVSEDSQAQWLHPPEDIEGVIISLVNVAENMVSSQCYIKFS